MRSAGLSGGMGIINYSQSGVRLVTPVLIEPGIELECELGRREGGADGIACIARELNGFRTPSGMFASGMRVTSAAGGKSFKFEFPVARGRDECDMPFLAV